MRCVPAGRPAARSAAAAESWGLPATAPARRLSIGPMSPDSLPNHIRTPHIRPVQLIPVQKDGKQFLALRDPGQLSKQTMVVPPQTMQLLQQFQGMHDLEAISTAAGVPLDQVARLAEGLDKVGLLWGPTFERLEQERKVAIAAHGAIECQAAGGLGDSPEEWRTQLESWIEETDDPELEGTVRAIVAPHLDYQRGWPNYAAAYRCLDYAEKPDRVLILGTNHFGIGDGAILTEWGFETPLGRCDADKVITEALVKRLGDPVVIDQLDHASEHSVQLHIPWIQHTWGNLPIVAAMVPDPLLPMIDDVEDPEAQERIDGGRLVEALRDTLEKVGGTTFVIASADLSHVGPQFGEPRQVDNQRKHDVELHDREMMGKYLTGDPEEFLSAMQWNNNPTRWCSVGNMLAALELTAPCEVELIDYRQACDEKGVALVSCASMAIL